MRYITFALALLAVTMFSTVALAADAPVLHGWEVVLSTFLKVFVAVAVPVLSTLAVALLRRWNVKVKYDTVYDLAHRGAAYAEQMAQKRLKTGKPTSSALKLQEAMKVATELAEQYRLPARATAKLQQLIESALGEKKLSKEG